MWNGNATAIAARSRLCRTAQAKAPTRPRYISRKIYRDGGGFGALELVEYLMQLGVPVPAIMPEDVLDVAMTRAENLNLDSGELARNAAGVALHRFVQTAQRYALDLDMADVVITVSDIGRSDLLAAATRHNRFSDGYKDIYRHEGAPSPASEATREASDPPRFNWDLTR